MFQNFWQRLIGNNYLAAISFSVKTSLCNAFFGLFVSALFCLSFCFLFCEYACVRFVCVIYLRVVCFCTSVVTAFQFLCTSAVENYLYAHNLVFH